MRELHNETRKDHEKNPLSAGQLYGVDHVVRRSNQRDNRQDRNQNRREGRSNVRDERSERHERRENRFRRHRARHITRAAFRGLSCTSTVVIVGSVTYYTCGGTYYERVYQGGEVVYIVVTNPT